MKKLKHFKFKIYRRFQSEIWGSIILKGKKNNALRMILRNFKYTRYLVAIKRKWSTLSSYYTNRNKSKRQLYFAKQHFKTSNTLYNTFWVKFINFYKKLDSKVSSINHGNNNFINKNKAFINNFALLNYLSWRSYKFRAKFFFKFQFFRRFSRKKYSHKNHPYSFVMDDYIAKKKTHYVREKIPFWIESKLEREKISLFFGLLNKRKYLTAQKALVKDFKIKANSVFFLLGQLTFFLFTLNFHTSMYSIRNIIKLRHILINNKIRTNPFFNLATNDNLGVIKSKIMFYYNFIKLRFKTKLILFNIPNYVEMKYSIMTASIWKTPTLEKTVGPYDYPFETLSFDWLQYNRGNILPRKRFYK